MLLVLGMGCDATIGRIYHVIGDSTSLSLLEQLTFCASLRPDGDLVIPLATVPGYALGGQVDYFALRMASAYGGRLAPPDATVILLGVNDMRPGGDESYALIDTDPELDHAIDVLLSAVPPHVPILWIENTAPVLEAFKVAHFHAGLVRAQSRYPHLSLLRPDPSVYGDHDVHFSDAGAQDVAKAIVDALDATFSRRSDS